VHVTRIYILPHSCVLILNIYLSQAPGLRLTQFDEKKKNYKLREEKQILCYTYVITYKRRMRIIDNI